SVQRNCTRLSRATLPLSPSHRTWPDPPRPATAALGFPSSTVTTGEGDGLDDELGDVAGLGPSAASSAARDAAKAQARSAAQRAARARLGADVIEPPGCGSGVPDLLSSTAGAVQRGAVGDVRARRAQALAEDVQDAAHDLDVARHQLGEGLAVEPE